jgi:hypothetical protein
MRIAVRGAIKVREVIERARRAGLLASGGDGKQSKVEGAQSRMWESGVHPRPTTFDLQPA